MFTTNYSYDKYLEELTNLHVFYDLRFDYTYYCYKNIYTNTNLITDDLVDKSLLLCTNDKLPLIFYYYNNPILKNNKFYLREDWKNISEENLILYKIYLTLKKLNYHNPNGYSPSSTISFSEYIKKVQYSFYAQWYYKTKNYLKLEETMENSITNETEDAYWIGFEFMLTKDDFIKIKNKKTKYYFENIEIWETSPESNEKNKPKNNYNFDIIDFKIEHYRRTKLDNFGAVHYMTYLNNELDICNTLEKINTNPKKYLNSYFNQ